MGEMATTEESPQSFPIFPNPVPVWESLLQGTQGLGQVWAAL